MPDSHERTQTPSPHPTISPRRPSLPLAVTKWSAPVPRTNPSDAFCTNEPEHHPVGSPRPVDPPPARRMTEAASLPLTPPVIPRLDRGTHCPTPALEQANPSGPDLPLVMAVHRAGHPVRRRSRGMTDDTNEPETDPRRTSSRHPLDGRLQAGHDEKDSGSHSILPERTRVPKDYETNPSRPDLLIVMAGHRAGHPVRHRPRTMTDDTNEPETGPRRTSFRRQQDGRLEIGHDDRDSGRHTSLPNEPDQWIARLRGG